MHQPTESQIPEPFDGQRKGVWGVVQGLHRISEQLDVLIRLNMANQQNQGQVKKL